MSGNDERWNWNGLETIRRLIDTRSTVDASNSKRTLQVKALNTESLDSNSEQRHTYLPPDLFGTDVWRLLTEPN